jgi:hypothetical protein
MAGHFRADNVAQKNDAKPVFLQYFQQIWPDRNPFPWGNAQNLTTTCSGDKKNFQKSYDNVIRRSFAPKIAAPQPPPSLFTARTQNDLWINQGKAFSATDGTDFTDGILDYALFARKILCSEEFASEKERDNQK